MRPLLIGMAPGPNTKPEYPLYPYPMTSAGGRLMQFGGFGRREFLLTFDRTNVLQRFPGQNAAAQDKFPRGAARVAAQAMTPLIRGRFVVMVGRKVGDAFGTDAPFFEWSACPRLGFIYAVVPHTSGRCQLYNDEMARLRLREVLRQAAAESVPALNGPEWLLDEQKRAMYRRTGATHGWLSRETEIENEPEQRGGHPHPRSEQAVRSADCGSVGSVQLAA